MNLKYVLLFSLMLGSIFSSCCIQKITATSRYVTVDSLASYHVGTPDPRLCHPPQGQVVTVSWFLYNEFSRYQTVEGKLRLLYRDHQQTTQTFPINSFWGSHSFALLNEEYFSSGGILAYKAEIYGDGELIQDWTHQLWTEIILFTPPDHQESTSAFNDENWCDDEDDDEEEDEDE